MDSVYIGIDIGTTTIKIVAINIEMKILYETQTFYNYENPKSKWNEINPVVWLDFIFKELKELFLVIDCKRIKGIGITGQMHTTTFIDKYGKSVRSAILWNDHRTITDIPKIVNRLKKLKKGNQNSKIVSTGSPLANLLWVKENEPQNYEKIHRILTPKDYVVFKLTSVLSTDFCDASTSSMYDFEEDRWSEEVLSEFCIEHSLLPNINPASKVVGYLQQDIQTYLGIDRAIPVIAGTGDNVAAAVATGGFEAETPILSLGTSGVVIIPDKQHNLKKIGKNVVAKIDKHDNSIITQGTVQAGAKCNSWFLEKICHTDDFNYEQSMIHKSMLGENEVLFFPHLNGEKTLYASSDLRGAFCGLSLETDRENMYLAVLEGLAFGMKKLYNSMTNKKNSESFIVVGGGSKSTLWLKIFSNIFQTPMKRLTHSGEAVQGAAILVMMGFNEQIRYIQDVEVVEPNLELIAKYEKKFEKYIAFEKNILNYMEEVK